MNIQNNCIYTDLNDLFCQACNNQQSILSAMKDIENAVTDGCAAAAFVISNEKKLDIPDNQTKSFFYQELKKIDVITFLICSDFSGIPLEIMLMFDQRLGMTEYINNNSDDTDSYVFDYKSRIRVLFGENNKNIVCVLNNSEKTFTELADSYIKKISGNKNINQLRALQRCFSHAKHDSIDEAEMLREESVQFCSLIVQQ